MTYLRWSLMALVAIVGLVTVIGYFLPEAHTASRDTVIAAAAPDVFATISDVERYPDWWSDISRVEMLPGDGGRVRFREHMSTGPVVMEVEQAMAPTRFVTRIADPDQPFGGTWTFELVPADSGTRVTITERGEVYNPIFRFMSRFIFGYTGTMESCLRALETKWARQ